MNRRSKLGTVVVAVGDRAVRRPGRRSPRWSGPGTRWSCRPAPAAGPAGTCWETWCSTARPTTCTSSAGRVLRRSTTPGRSGTGPGTTRRVTWETDPDNPVLGAGAGPVGRLHHRQHRRCCTTGRCSTCGTARRAAVRPVPTSGMRPPRTGADWDKHADNPLAGLDPGPPGTWDDNGTLPIHGARRRLDPTACGTPAFQGDTWAGTWRIGHATLDRRGLIWTRDPNPVLEASEPWEGSKVYFPDGGALRRPPAHVVQRPQRVTAGDGLCRVPRRPQLDEVARQPGADSLAWVQPRRLVRGDPRWGTRPTAGSATATTSTTSPRRWCCSPTTSRTGQPRPGRSRRRRRAGDRSGTFLCPARPAGGAFVGSPVGLVAAPENEKERPRWACRVTRVCRVRMGAAK